MTERHNNSSEGYAASGLFKVLGGGILATLVLGGLLNSGPLFRPSSDPELPSFGDEASLPSGREVANIVSRSSDARGDTSSPTEASYRSNPSTASGLPAGNSASAQGPASRLSGTAGSGVQMFPGGRQPVAVSSTAGQSSTKPGTADSGVALASNDADSEAVATGLASREGGLQTAGALAGSRSVSGTSGQPSSARAGAYPSDSRATPGPSEVPADPPSWNQGSRSGIEVASLRLSAAGRALDFRWKVVDQALAAKVGRDGGPMYILDSSGQRVAERNVPAIGKSYEVRHLDKPDRTYSTWFSNPGTSVNRGDYVTIVMGDFRISSVQVQ